jgi:hypothetical protein
MKFPDWCKKEGNKKYKDIKNGSISFESNLCLLEYIYGIV